MGKHVSHVCEAHVQSLCQRRVPPALLDQKMIGDLLTSVLLICQWLKKSEIEIEIKKQPFRGAQSSVKTDFLRQKAHFRTSFIIKIIKFMFRLHSAFKMDGKAFDLSLPFPTASNIWCFLARTLNFLHEHTSANESLAFGLIEMVKELGNRAWKVCDRFRMWQIFSNSTMDTPRIKPNPKTSSANQSTPQDKNPRLRLTSQFSSWLFGNEKFDAKGWSGIQKNNIRVYSFVWKWCCYFRFLHFQQIDPTAVNLDTRATFAFHSFAKYGEHLQLHTVRLIHILEFQPNSVFFQGPAYMTLHIRI